MLNRIITAGPPTHDVFTNSLGNRRARVPYLLSSPRIRDSAVFHDGLVPRPNSYRTLAQGVLYLNHSISRIAVKFLWKELDSTLPLHALFPLDYCQPCGSKYVSCVYRWTHWTTIELLGAIDIREERNA